MLLENVDASDYILKTISSQVNLGYLEGQSCAVSLHFEVAGSGAANSIRQIGPSSYKGPSNSRKVGASLFATHR